MLLRTAARRVAAARPSLRRTAPQALATRQLAYQGLHEALEKKLGTQPTRLPQDADELPKSFDVGERAAELGVRLSQHELDNLYAELKKGTKKESNAAYVDAVQATASVGAERQYLAEFITSSDEHSTGQKVLLFLDYLSTALFALIGAQYAGIAGMNVVGATLVGVVGGVGGGTVTGALTGANAARGVFWMRDPRYLLLSTVVAVATYYLWPKYLEWTGRDRFEQLARASSSNPHGKLSADAFELALRQDEELRKELRMLESHLNEREKKIALRDPQQRPSLYFRHLDRDGDGYLTREDLSSVARMAVTDSPGFYALETVALGGVACFGAQAGVTRALPPAACIATGVTICFGGVLRDVLCRRDVAIGGQSYALATAMGASAYVGMRELVVRGVMRIPLLMRIGVAYTVTVLERIYVWYDDASDSFLRPWPPEIVEAHINKRSEEEPRRRTTEVKRRFTGDD